MMPGKKSETYFRSLEEKKANDIDARHLIGVPLFWVRSPRKKRRNSQFTHAKHNRKLVQRRDPQRSILFPATGWVHNEPVKAFPSHPEDGLDLLPVPALGRRSPEGASKRSAGGHQLMAMSTLSCATRPPLFQAYPFKRIPAIYCIYPLSKSLSALKRAMGKSAVPS